MIDNESPRRTAQSFELRRTSPDFDVYELHVDGEVLPWDFLSVLAVEHLDKRTGLKIVHLGLLVDGEVTIDPSLEPIPGDDPDITHYAKDSRADPDDDEQGPRE